MMSDDLKALILDRRLIFNKIERQCAWYQAGEHDPSWGAVLTAKVEQLLEESSEIRQRDELIRIAAMCIVQIERIESKNLERFCEN